MKQQDVRPVLTKCYRSYTVLSQVSYHTSGRKWWLLARLDQIHDILS